MKYITTFFTLFTLFILSLLFSCKQTDKSGNASVADERFDYLINQSKAFDKVYDYDAALLYGDSAYNYALIRKDEKKMAKALLRKGVVFQNSNKLDSSRAYILKAVQVAEKAGDSLYLALSLNTLGNTTKRMEKTDEALEYFQRAENIFEKMGDKRRQAYVLLNIGNIYYRIKDFEKALPLYQKCKFVSEKAENEEMTRTSSFNIANIFSKLTKYDEAESAYLFVIELDKKSKDDKSLALDYANLSIVYASNNKQELHFEYLNKALELAKKTKDTRTESQTYNLLGNYYSENGEYTKAEKAYKQSILLAKKIGNLSFLKSAYANLASLKEETGHFEQALSYYKLYTELSDSIINNKKLELIYELESKYEKKKDEAEILQLSNKNAEQEIRNRDLKIQLITVAGIVFLLLGMLFFIRLKNRKDNVIAQQRIQQLEEEQKLLAAQSVIVGQENERKRIAQELHDGIGVLLSTASIHFSNAADSTDEKTAQLLGKANKLLTRAGGEVRKISHEMMPGVLSKFGLQEAVEDLFENVEDTGSIDVECEVTMADQRLNENTEIILYRIVQEILNNTLKHAHAKNIHFSMKLETNTLVINYKDDGNGFEQSKTVSGQSLGLSGIQSRVDFLKGKIQLVSDIGKGVAYNIQIPV